MKAWLTEWFYVLAYSWRSRLVLVLGIAIACLTWLAGHLWAARVDVSGPLAPMTEPIRLLITERYEGVAIMIVATTLVGVVRQLRKDRRRLFDL